MIVYPNCKINLGLKVLDRRKDGFHNLESIFIPIPWHDALEIIENKNAAKTKVKYSSSGLPIQGSLDSNLCIKAYKLLDQKFKLPPIKMHLHKIIPMGAGLGGGSSDGAFALKLLNELFSLKLSKLELQKLAGLLGSDCPFFIKNQTVFVTGRGEKLKPINLTLEGLHLTIVHPEIHISTAAAFKNIQKSAYKETFENLGAWDIKTWHKQIENDFEGYAFEQFPVLQAIKDELYHKGALYASMSGSGSAIYGISETKIRLAAAWKKYNVFQCQL